MNEAQARALIAAGRLLQSKAWPGGRVKIERGSGEDYPQAVFRVIASLEDRDRDCLRELVEWVIAYEKIESHDINEKMASAHRRN